MFAAFKQGGVSSPLVPAISMGNTAFDVAVGDKAHRRYDDVNRLRFPWRDHGECNPDQPIVIKPDTHGSFAGHTGSPDGAGTKVDLNKIQRLCTQPFSLRCFLRLCDSGLCVRVLKKEAKHFARCIRTVRIGV
jgi:hypothetical protein